MKTLTTFTVTVGMLLTSCTTAGIQSSIPTSMEITAIASTGIAETPGPAPTAGPAPTPVPVTFLPTLQSATLSPTELKYTVLEQFPDFFFCDPDYYPIARQDEMVLAQQRFPELQANREEFEAILSHIGLSGTTNFIDDEKLLIYREHKKLNAIYFELIGDQFRFQIQTGSEGQQGYLITGSINGNGSIEIQQRDQSFPSCPICLAAGTLIDSPHGQIAVQELQVGDVVWTLDASGERVAAAILKTSRVPVPANHQMVHVILSDGRELWASPGHPTTDGKMLSDLKAGDLLDGTPVLWVELVSYDQAATYDLLPSGDTGFYWANGILIGSTLADK